MRVIAKIIIILTSLALVCLVGAHVITSSVTNEDLLSKQFESAGVYSLGAESLQESFQESLKAANVSDPVVGEILAKSVTAEAVASAAKPVIGEFTDWIVAKGGEELKLALDLTSIKSQIVRESKLRGSIETSFVVTREVPDSLSLLETSKAGSNYEGLQQAYQRANALVLPLLVGVLAGMGLLVLLALRLPHKRLAWPGWVLIAAAVVGIVLVYATPTLLAATILKEGAVNAEINRISLGLIRATLDASRLYWYVLAAAGAGLFALSIPLQHRYNKRQKKGRH
jgi:hypothetical protein